jgi:hypothetical protein
MAIRASSGDPLRFAGALDDSSRFRRSRDVAAYFGLTSRRWQSGTSIGVQGRISKAGDGDVRRALYEAASALMTRFKGRDKVRTWDLALAKRSCHRKATVAVARKLAVIMHAMWTEPATSATWQPARAIGRRTPLGRMAACWELRHEHAPDTFDAVVRHPDGHQLNNGALLRQMRTGADQGRRNARYLACGRGPCGVFGPCPIACDDAPSIRWKSAPRRF